MKQTTRQRMLDAHEMFNDYFFKGLLNTPNFIFYDHYEVEGVGNVWGSFEKPQNIILTVNDEIITTLLHEMIHQYQHEFNLIDKEHGTTFRKYARTFEQSLNLPKGSI